MHEERKVLKGYIRNIYIICSVERQNYGNNAELFKNTIISVERQNVNYGNNAE